MLAIQICPFKRIFCLHGAKCRGYHYDPRVSNHCISSFWAQIMNDLSKMGVNIMCVSAVTTCYSVVLVIPALTRNKDWRTAVIPCHDWDENETLSQTLSIWLFLQMIAPWFSDYPELPVVLAKPSTSSLHKFRYHLTPLPINTIFKCRWWSDLQCRDETEQTKNW